MAGLAGKTSQCRTINRCGSRGKSCQRWASMAVASMKAVSPISSPSKRTVAATSILNCIRRPTSREERASLCRIRHKWSWKENSHVTWKKWSTLSSRGSRRALSAFRSSWSMWRTSGEANLISPATWTRYLWKPAQTTYWIRIVLGKRL